MRQLKSITETDYYIQRFECVQRLMENEGKLTIMGNSELEERMDYLSRKIHGELIAKEYYRKP
ncbi:hypothetical protein, partial [Priestia megaterium]|uniref:hypothetical protein n=1 Tax=Priestia megaterium TaxID=1404 RepID=UPI003008AE28